MPYEQAIIRTAPKCTRCTTIMACMSWMRRTSKITVTIQSVTCQGGSRPIYFLNVCFVLKENTSWADVGHVVASSQFALTGRVAIPAVDLFELRALEYEAQGDHILVKGEDFQIIVSQEQSTIISLKYDDKEMLRDQNGFRLNWYRCVSNDKYADQSYYPATIKKKGIIFNVDQSKKFITFTIDQEVNIHDPEKPVSMAYQATYTVYSKMWRHNLKSRPMSQL